MHITHLAYDTPEKDRAKRLSFITQDEGQGSFYPGFERVHPFTKDKIDEQVAERHLIPVNPPYRIDRMRTPWLFSDGSIWVALCERPLTDRHRVLLARSFDEMMTRTVPV